MDWRAFSSNAFDIRLPFHHITSIIPIDAIPTKENDIMTHDEITSTIFDRLDECALDSSSMRTLNEAEKRRREAAE